MLAHVCIYIYLYIDRCQVVVKIYRYLYVIQNLLLYGLICGTVQTLYTVPQGKCKLGIILNLLIATMAATSTNGAAPTHSQRASYESHTWAPSKPSQPLEPESGECHAPSTIWPSAIAPVRPTVDSQAAQGRLTGSSGIILAVWE